MGEMADLTARPASAQAARVIRTVTDVMAFVATRTMEWYSCPGYVEVAIRGTAGNCVHGIVETLLFGERTPVQGREAVAHG